MQFPLRSKSSGGSCQQPSVTSTDRTLGIVVPSGALAIFALLPIAFTPRASDRALAFLATHDSPTKFVDIVGAIGSPSTIRAIPNRWCLCFSHSSSLLIFDLGTSGITLA